MSDTIERSTEASENENTNPITTPVVNLTKYKEYYAELLPEIQQVPRDAIANVNMSTDIYLKEAEQLLEIVKRNIGPMLERNYDESHTVALAKLTGASRIALSNMHTDSGTNKVTWKEIAPEAFELRDTLLTEFKYACTDAPKKIEILKEISKGATISDMIQDLFDLSSLSESIQPELQATNFPMELLTRTNELSEELGAMQISAKLDRSNNTESRIIRDQAVTLLSYTIGAIRHCAEFVFKKDQKTAELFKSNYMRQQYAKTKKLKEEATNTSSDAASEIVV